MKRKTFVWGAMLLMICALLASCATMKPGYDQLTEDQKARACLGDAIIELNVLLDAGRAYVMANPSREEQWNTVVYPKFVEAGELIVGLVTKGKTQGLTEAEVKTQVNAKVLEIETILLTWGIYHKKK